MMLLYIIYIYIWRHFREMDRNKYRSIDRYLSIQLKYRHTYCNVFSVRISHASTSSAKSVTHLQTFFLLDINSWKEHKLRYRVFIKYCVFSRKFATSPSSALGCYWSYKNYQPIGLYTRIALRALKVSYSDVGEGGVAVNCEKTHFFLDTLDSATIAARAGR